MLTYFVACLCKTSESRLTDSRAMPPSSVCVYFPYQANPAPTPYTPSREACHPNVGGVLPLCRYVLGMYSMHGTIYRIAHNRAIRPCLTFFSFLFLISLIADGPHHGHPACGHKGSSHLSPVHTFQLFIAMQVQHSYNSSTNG